MTFLSPATQQCPITTVLGYRPASHSKDDSHLPFVVKNATVQRLYFIPGEKIYHNQTVAPFSYDTRNFDVDVQAFKLSDFLALESRVRTGGRRTVSGASFSYQLCGFLWLSR